MMDTNEIYDLAEHVVDYALSLGADQVEAYLISGSSRSVQLELGSIRRFTETSNSGLGVRVVKGKSIGMTSTTIFKPESVEKIVEDAFSLAKVSPDDDNFVSLPTDSTHAPTLKNRFDKNIPTLSVEDFTDIILEAVQKAKVTDEAVISGNFNAGYGRRIIYNSLGIERNSSQTSVSGYLGVKIQKDDDVGNAYYFDATPMLKDFNHIKIGTEAGQRAIKMLGSQKVDTKNLPILMDPDSSYGTLSIILANGINAFNVFNKTAFFIDKIGDTIASEKLTIIDDPFVSGGTDSAPFDDEGVVSKKMTLVKEGILQTYLTDSYTAPLVGLENTGHASRNSFSARPRPSPYSLEISAGESAKDEMLSEIKEGILLIGSPIYPMGNNPQVSSQVNQGFYVENGEIQYPVRNTVIGCTVFDIFEKIDDISKETENRRGHIAPWVYLEPLRVSGGK